MVRDPRKLPGPGREQMDGIHADSENELHGSSPWIRMALFPGTRRDQEGPGRRARQVRLLAWCKAASLAMHENWSRQRAAMITISSWFRKDGVTAWLRVADPTAVEVGCSCRKALAMITLCATKVVDNAFCGRGPMVRDGRMVGQARKVHTMQRQSQRGGKLVARLVLFKWAVPAGWEGEARRMYRRRRVSYRAYARSYLHRAELW